MIQDPPLLTIKREWQRPDPKLVARLAGAMTGHVIDTMDGSGAMTAAIKPVDPARASFTGVAITCETGPGDNLAIMGALALAQPGDVIVAAADGFLGSAIVGDNVCWMARNGGVVGLVTDGVVRDAVGIREIGVPTFAAGIVPNSGARNGPGRVGLPVVCGGVAVVSGDVLVADADGVVVVPQARLAEVLARLDEVLAAEKALQARIAEGLTHMQAVADLLKSDRVRYV
jgi:4-hydroxy-4-methyl-2-oxoglutarate aldolase